MRRVPTYRPRRPDPPDPPDVAALRIIAAALVFGAYCAVRAWFGR